METNELRRELRRNQDTLAIIGMGVIAFGAWTLVRTIMTTLLRIPLIREMRQEGRFEAVILIAFAAFYLFAAFLELILRLYVGRAARAEALRGKRKKGFLPAACFLVLLSLLSLGLPALEFVQTGVDMDNVITFVIELTSLVTLIEMIAASVRVRRMTKDLALKRE